MLRIQLVFGLLFLSSACLACHADAHEHVRDSGDAARGLALARELGCANCHASEHVAAEPGPRLVGVGARLTPGAIEAALESRVRMPDCLARLPQGERPQAQAELVHFLVSLGGPLVGQARAVDALTLERGRQLYHSIGCVACHDPFEGADTLTKPLWEYEEAFERSVAEPSAPEFARREPRSLVGLGARTTAEALERLLVDPLAVHPSGRMPSLGLSAGEAHDLALYLLYEDSLDDGAVLTAGPGLLLDSYEADFQGETADFDALTPVRTETATSFFEGLQHRDEDFGLRFRGLLEIATAGQYRFSTRSDDGSMLYIDGRLVVDNHGQHAMSEQSGEVHLEPGRHAIEVTYFEHHGDEGLEVEWSGPGRAKGPLGFEVLSHLEVRLPGTPAQAFAVDDELVDRGRELYEDLGCASCHTHCGEQPRALAELDPRQGCLAETPRGVPRYAFAPGQRADLVAALEAGTEREPTAAARLEQELVRLDCGACHARGTLAGPDGARRRYFQVADGLDLGDEGRLPPSLERVGAKLKPAWFHTVLEEGARARPYMRTRMPQFGAQSVAGLAELFAEVDAPLRDEREPAFSAEAVEAGKLLAGTKGLGCIQCHELAGHPSIGIPAVDLARVHERIYPGWFRELLMDPIALGMNRRMPAFWVDGKSPVKDVCEGDPLRQVEALWSYLSLGSSMPLPAGLVPLEGEFEVEVYDTPVCVGVFMAGVSPRTVAVGLPERVHYAFDVESSRLARAWRGRFLDARGTWFGRAGQLEQPAGEDVLEFPRGAPVALLDAPDDPWPEEGGQHAGPRALGRRLDAKGRPVFAYSVCGVRIEESIVPRLRAGGGVLVRLFAADSAAPQLFLRVAVGTRVTEERPGNWVVTGNPELRVCAPDSAFVVPSSGGDELRVPVAPSSRSVEVEYSW